MARDKDLFSECFDPQFGLDHKGFIAANCDICRNPACMRAGRADTIWQRRMDTQFERLVLNPQFSDLSNEQHQNIHAVDFPEMMREAIRLEIADQRRDFTEITDEDVLDYLSGKGVQEAVDKSLSKLRAMRDAESGEPKESGETKIESPVEKQLREHVHAQIQATMEAEEEEPVSPPPDTSVEEIVETPEPASQKRPAHFQGAEQVNTEFPEEGIMLGGAEAPRSAPVEDDPWEPKSPAPRKVAAHATVRMKGDKDPDQE